MSIFALSIARRCSISRHVKCANSHATGYRRTTNSNMRVKLSQPLMYLPVHTSTDGLPEALHPSIISEFAAATMSLATHFPGDQINFDMK